MNDTSYLTGLLGRDLSGSLSPALHNEGFRALGVPGFYQPIDFSERSLQDTDLAEVLASLVRLGFAGCNVTHPFKTAIMPLLDNVSDDAAQLGAVNTVVIRDGKTTGHNTDWLGFAAQLDALETKSAIPHQGAALVLGAGGAGRAVIYGLQQKTTSSILIHDPDMAQAQATVAHFDDPRINLVIDLESATDQAMLLVNASTVGMHGKGGLPLAPHLIRPRHQIAEVVYFPLETPLVKYVRSLGSQFVTGDIMCLHQAMAAFDLMSGLKANRKKMTEFFSNLVA